VEEGRANEAYNICSGQAVSLREVVGKLVAEFGLELELADESDGEGSSDSPPFCGDSTKLRSQLGWEPARSVQGAVHELAESCRKKQAVAV
jgi:nucleoside-diphosphate-sugar epimerase